MAASASLRCVDLAAIDGEQRCLPAALVENQFVVAGYVLGPVGVIIVQRPDTGKRPYQLVRDHLVAKILIHGIAKIGDLRRIGRERTEIADEILIGGTDQREIIGERQNKHDAPVRRLQQIAVIVIEAPTDDDVAALDQPHRRRQRLADDSVRDPTDPRTGGIGQYARGVHFAASARVQHQFPFIPPLHPRTARAGSNDGATLRGIERIEHDET